MIYKLFDKTNFEFTVPDTPKIGLFMSGGIDSVTLLGMIITELHTTKRNIPITAYTTYKYTREQDYTPRLIELISKHFNVAVEHVNNIPNREEYLREGIADPQNMFDVYNSHNGDIKIYAANNNQAEETFDIFKHRTLQYTQQPNICSPFLNSKKTQIVDIMYQINLDFLLPYTHSCARWAVGNCNNCYNCEERSWAFEVLKKKNPDTIPLED